MSSADTFSQRPSGPPHHDTDDRWAMPLGKIAGLPLYLSYSVFVATAVLIGIVGMVSTQPGNTGNGDLAKTALIAAGFWVAGWIVQTVVHLFFRFARNVPIEALTIGLRGIESRRRVWDAKDALAVSASALLALFAFGGSVMMTGVLMSDAGNAQGSFAVWETPSFGLGVADFVWISGGWICLVQMICQAFPLPCSLGRTAIVAAVALAGSRANEAFQTHFCRRAIQIVALLTSLLALASLLTEQTVFAPRWPLLMFFAIILWISSRGQSLRQAIINFGTFSDWDDLDHQAPATQVAQGSWLSRAKQSARSLSQRRRLRQAMQQEHQEANDAERLDGVLQQLHAAGRESLSADDLALLKRVSDSLRHQRELGLKQEDNQ